MSGRDPGWLMLAAGAALPTVAALAFLYYVFRPEGPELSLPVACEPGRTCFIQSFVDVDTGTGAQDFACGSATYDGHKGTDFRVLSVAAAHRGVDVLASAVGIVKAVRDGMDDALASEATRREIAGRECGNGVVLDHGGGWETQYCHMLRGSIAVKAGERVARGERLGHVGYSGLAEFAHLHLEVRRDGQPIDPFSGRAQSEPCSPEKREWSGLWDRAALEAFRYRNGEILDAGFSADPAVLDRLELDDAVPPPDRGSSALVVYIRAANLRAGDRLRLSAKGPNGFAIDETSKPFDRSKATFHMFAGRKRTSPEWPAGRYHGEVSILRNNWIQASRSVTLELR